MWSTEICSPISTTHRNDAELGNDDGSTDGGCDFLGCFNTETDVTFRVPNDDDGLESGTLTGTGLLLDRLDLCIQERIRKCTTLYCIDRAASAVHSTQQRN